MVSIRAHWPGFLAKRAERLVQQQRHGVASEKVAENILEDLFTLVLDWSLSGLHNQLSALVISNRKGAPP